MVERPHDALTLQPIATALFASTGNNTLAVSDISPSSASPIVGS